MNFNRERRGKRGVFTRHFGTSMVGLLLRAFAKAIPTT